MLERKNKSRIIVTFWLELMVGYDFIYPEGEEKLILGGALKIVSEKIDLK